MKPFGSLVYLLPDAGNNSCITFEGVVKYEREKEEEREREREEEAPWFRFEVQTNSCKCYINCFSLPTQTQKLRRERSCCFPPPSRTCCCQEIQWNSHVPVFPALPPKKTPTRAAFSSGLTSPGSFLNGSTNSLHFHWTRREPEPDLSQNNLICDFPQNR